MVIAAERKKLLFTVIACGIALVACLPAARAVAPVGACCFPDGSCAQVLELQCESGGGTFAGIGLSCEQIACNISGAPLFSTAGMLLVVVVLGTLGLLHLRRRSS